MLVTLTTSSQSLYEFLSNEIIEATKAEITEETTGVVRVIRATTPEGITNDLVISKINRIFNRQDLLLDTYYELIGKERDSYTDIKKAWRMIDGVQLIVIVDDRSMLIGFNKDTNELMIIW